MKKRIGWVDIFRAICIIAIVMGHTSAKYGMYTRLFSVAAFFFISGFLTNYNKENFIDFFKNKFKSLMIPFFVINILFIMLRYLLKFVEIESIFYTDSINFTYLINLFKHFATTDLGGATWFLPILFFTNIIYKLLYDLIGKEDMKKKIYLFCISIGICIWGYWQYYNMQQYLSYSADLIYMALIFVASGSLFKEINKKYDKNIIINSIITILSIIGAIYILKNNDKGINWPTRDFPNIAFMMVSSFSFIWIFIQLSKIIEKIKYLSNVFIYIGKNSLPIFIYHFVSFRMLFCVFYKLNLVQKEQLYNLTPIYNNDLLFIITIVAGVIIPLIIDLIISYLKKIVHSKVNLKNNKLILYYQKKVFDRKSNKNIQK